MIVAIVRCPIKTDTTNAVKTTRICPVKSWGDLQTDHSSMQERWDSKLSVKFPFSILKSFSISGDEAMNKSHGMHFSPHVLLKKLTHIFLLFVFFSWQMTKFLHGVARFSAPFITFLWNYLSILLWSTNIAHSVL